ncbi:hypothetical protein Htur_3490 [Haloterrigena turkmenica DSM 5511]|uniref:Uncharacterized protein n=2 Tax=Haloterrigena turkmenica TaxID=62320 RepID=D2RQH5_HALTV|nr:hypothetical protein Htur_3490 [Haloterrigena turkmenica DSM 5511]
MRRSIRYSLALLAAGGIVAALMLVETADIDTNAVDDDDEQVPRPFEDGA